MAFLPAGYAEPTGGGSGGRYLKLEKGVTTRIRILSPTPLMGWEYWTEMGKPKRFKELTGTPEDIRRDENGAPERPKFFWAMAVWNYNSEAVQIWSVTQATVRKAIEDLVGDEDYQDPLKYDLKITRTGEKLETKYSVIPGKESDFTNQEAVAEAIAINWDAWMRSEDPFKGNSINPEPSSPEDLPKEFWKSMDIVGYSRDQAAKILVEVGAVDADGKPSTAALTAERYGQVINLIADDIPF
jgi:hypothetical protein